MRLLFFASILILGSCTVTKRVHRPGFNIEWNKKYSTHNKISDTDSSHVLANKSEFPNENKIGLVNTDSTRSTVDQKIRTKNDVTAIEQSKGKNLAIFNSPAKTLIENKNRTEQFEAFSTVLKKYTEPTATESKDENYYLTIGVLSMLLIIVLVIVALTTARSSIVMYTAGLAMFGIPLLFIYMIRSFRTAREIKASKPVKIVEEKPISKPELKEENEPKKEIPDTKTSATIGKPENDTVAIFSFILFLFSILLAFALPFLGLLLFFLSLVLAIYSLSRKTIDGKPLRYRGLAWFPVILTIIALVISLVILIAFLSF
jgi:hypothetical protein